MTGNIITLKPLSVAPATNINAQTNVLYRLGRIADPPRGE